MFATPLVRPLLLQSPAPCVQMCKGFVCMYLYARLCVCMCVCVQVRTLARVLILCRTSKLTPINILNFHSCAPSLRVVYFSSPPAPPLHYLSLLHNPDARTHTHTRTHRHTHTHTRENTHAKHTETHTHTCKVLGHEIDIHSWYNCKHA